MSDSTKASRKQAHRQVRRRAKAGRRLFFVVHETEHGTRELRRYVATCAAEAEAKHERAQARRLRGGAANESR